MKFKRLMTTAALPVLFAIGAGVSSNSHSAEISVSVTNLTYGMYFTPLFISAHNESVSLFEVGQTASPALEKMAELGMIGDLDTYTADMGAVNALNPVGETNFLPSGQTSPMVDINTGSNDYLSITAMLLPSNDGFIGLNGWKIPADKGTYHVMLNAYDAGTEANNELLGEGDENMPGDPTQQGGANGVGVTTEDAPFVHIHRGSLGDDDAAGGISDLNNSVHRWLNPVARVTVIVK